MIETTVMQVRVDRQLKKEAEITPQEDFYNPYNVAHLKQALADLNAGKTERHDLAEA